MYDIFLDYTLVNVPEIFIYFAHGIPYTDHLHSSLSVFVLLVMFDDTSASLQLLVIVWPSINVLSPTCRHNINLLCLSVFKDLFNMYIHYCFFLKWKRYQIVEFWTYWCLFNCKICVCVWTLNRKLGYINSLN